MDEELVVETHETEEGAEVAAVVGGELAALQEALARRDRDHAEALDALRSALCASEPAIAMEIVTGSTVTEVLASFAAARAQVERLRDEIRREQAVAVPAGSPGRVTSQPASPFEKIRNGLDRLVAG